MRSWSDGLNDLSEERLSTLLSMAGPAHGPTSWLPTSSEAIEQASAALQRMPEIAGGRPGAWLNEVAEASTPLARLVDIKRAAKELLRSVEDDGARTAAILVYHAAVAAAFARHSTVISSTPFGLRLGLYDGLGVALGTQPIGAVFRAAVERYLVP